MTAQVTPPFCIHCRLCDGEVVNNGKMASHAKSRRMVYLSIARICAKRGRHVIIQNAIQTNRMEVSTRSCFQTEKVTYKGVQID